MITGCARGLGGMRHDLVGARGAPGSYWGILVVRCRCHTGLASAECKFEAVFYDIGGRPTATAAPPSKIETARGPGPIE
jgi:hypothetical protein